MFMIVSTLRQTMPWKNSIGTTKMAAMVSHTIHSDTRIITCEQTHRVTLDYMHTKIETNDRKFD